MQEQIDEVTEAIAQVKQNGGGAFTIKQMERTRKSLENKLEKLRADKRKDGEVPSLEMLVRCHILLNLPTK